MRFLLRVALLFLVVHLLTPVIGCGGGSGRQDCRITAISISPTSASADHHLDPPHNMQQFFAFGESPSGCFTPMSNLANVEWSVSDPASVEISNKFDQTYGMATCLNATADPVTVTATMHRASGAPLKATARFLCN